MKKQKTIRKSLRYGKENVKFLYEGSKIFWKLRCTLDIFIQKHDISLGEYIEVIAYHPTEGIESNHLFLDVEKIKSKRTNLSGTPIGEPINQFSIHYVLSRLGISHIDKDEEDLEICLIPIFSDVIDENTGLLDTIIDLPEKIIPTVIQKKKVIPYVHFFLQFSFLC